MKKRVWVLVFVISLSWTSADVFFADDFEAYDVGLDGDDMNSLLIDLESSSWGGSSVSSGDSVTVSDNIAYLGSNSLRFQWRAGGVTGGGAEQRFHFGNPKSEIYVRFYIYFPDGSEPNDSRYVHRDGPSSDNNKLFRIWQNDYNYGKWGASFNRRDDNISYMSARGNVDEGCGDNDNIPGMYDVYQITDDKLGRWIAFEYHFKPDSGAGDGIWEFWADGEYVNGRTDIVTSGAPCSPLTFQHGYILGYSNSGFDEITTVYVDDVAFSNNYIGLVGGAVCDDGDIRDCLTGLSGICFEGIETCLDGVYGECVQDNVSVEEVCGNGVDEDCDGEDLVCGVDNDSDGFNSSVDCNDSNELVYPGAEEVCGDFVDQDCDGSDLECESFHDADLEPCDGVVSVGELRGYIDLWLGGGASISEVMGAIGAWAG